MKKLGLMLIVVLAVMSLVVVGCGGDDGEAEGAPTPTLQVTPAPTPTATPMTTLTPTPTPTLAPTPEATATPGHTQPSGELSDLLSKTSDIDSVSYDMVSTGPGVPSMNTKVWVKTKPETKMKTETKAEGETVVSIVDYAAQNAYMYLPSQNMAFQMDLSDAPESPVEGTEAIEGYNPTIIGTETYDGKECLVVEYAVEGFETKMWVWKRYGFPVKVETVTPEGKMTFEHKNLDFSNIPDSVFELPSGVQITQMPSYE
jgi:outer membrane lipoprotein-sorting protein